MLPSGAHATPDTEGCPVSTAEARNADTDQIRTLPSTDPDASCVPFGEKAVEVTSPVWPSSVATCCHEMRFHTATTLLLLPVDCSTPRAPPRPWRAPPRPPASLPSSPPPSLRPMMKAAEVPAERYLMLQWAGGMAVQERRGEAPY